jgi:hypothetical protein
LGLTPEKATTFNFGAVFNAPSNDGIFGDVSLSVDYYNIKIKNVISGVPGATVFSKCYNLDGSNPTYSATNDFCRLVNRDSTGQLSNVSTPFLNLGALETDGVEVQMHWGMPARPSSISPGSVRAVPSQAAFHRARHRNGRR